MANYKETTGTGTSWRRASQVIIDNTFQSTEKSITFIEEDVIQLGDKTVTAKASFVRGAFNPEQLIVLRDPATGERTGNTVPQALVYQALYSLYLDLAEARDSTPENILTMQ